MQGHDIAHVCCLLADTVESYEDLLGRYEAVFGPDRVCAAPISVEPNTAENWLQACAFVCNQLTEHYAPNRP